MPYALIPDGYSLKKVTKLQKQAVNEKRRHDDVVAFLNNPNTPLLMGGAGLLALTPILLNLFYQSLEGQNIILTDEQRALTNKAFETGLLLNPITAPILLGKKAAEGLAGLSLSDLEKALGPRVADIVGLV